MYAIGMSLNLNYGKLYGKLYIYIYMGSGRYVAVRVRAVQKERKQSKASDSSLI